MCSTPKIPSAQENSEVIKEAVQADASIQKTTPANNLRTKGIISQNIRTSNNGIDDDVIASKKKLLGE